MSGINLDAIQARADAARLCDYPGCDEVACQARRDNAALVKVVRAVLAIHRDGGLSQGYTRDGYRTIDHCCLACGSFGEYGVAYPCPTVSAITAHIDTTPEGEAMNDRYEMPHARADECPHVGVGKACRDRFERDQITTADLLDEYACALRGSWGDIDGRSEQGALNCFSDAIREYGNAPLTESEVARLRDDLGVCPHGGSHWTDYCDDECEEMDR